VKSYGRVEKVRIYGMVGGYPVHEDENRWVAKTEMKSLSEIQKEIDDHIKMARTELRRKHNKAKEKK